MLTQITCTKIKFNLWIKVNLTLGFCYNYTLLLS